MSLFTTLFPIPSYFALPAVGIEFSDTRLRYVELRHVTAGIAPARFGEVGIPQGCVQGGRIIDEKKFTEFLAHLKAQEGFDFVRVGIPESQVYLFTLSLDHAAQADIRGAITLVIEDNIPLKAEEVVFDFSLLKTSDTRLVVQVVAVSHLTANTLHTSLVNAGLKPLSFELDAQAIARAVVPTRDHGCRMIVDIGAHRTGISITAEGSVVYTATIEFGGEVLTNSIASALGITPEEAEESKRTIGLSHNSEHAQFFTALSKGITPLKEEINRRYLYWQEKKDALGGFPSIDTIYLCGGHSNLLGLADYLTATLRLPVLQANPWVNCVSFEEHIPEMSLEASMSYVAAIGLALADHLSS